MRVEAPVCFQTALVTIALTTLMYLPAALKIVCACLYNEGGASLATKTQMSCHADSKTDCHEDWISTITRTEISSDDLNVLEKVNQSLRE